MWLQFSAVFLLKYSQLPVVYQNYLSLCFESVLKFWCSCKNSQFCMCVLSRNLLALRNWNLQTPWHHSLLRLSQQLSLMSLCVLPTEGVRARCVPGLQRWSRVSPAARASCWGLGCGQAWGARAGSLSPVCVQWPLCWCQSSAEEGIGSDLVGTKPKLGERDTGKGCIYAAVWMWAEGILVAL